MSKQERLWETIEDFITKYEITCPETIHQSDRVIENAYWLIEKACEIVGYYNEEESNE